MKIRPVGQIHGRTDMTKPILAFRNFVNASKDICTILVNAECNVEEATFYNINFESHIIFCYILHHCCLKRILSSVCYIHTKQH